MTENYLMIITNNQDNRYGINIYPLKDYENDVMFLRIDPFLKPILMSSSNQDVSADVSFRFADVFVEVRTEHSCNIITEKSDCFRIFHLGVLCNFIVRDETALLEYIRNSNYSSALKIPLNEFTLTRALAHLHKASPNVRLYPSEYNSRIDTKEKQLFLILRRLCNDKVTDCDVVHIQREGSYEMKNLPIVIEVSSFEKEELYILFKSDVMRLEGFYVMDEDGGMTSLKRSKESILVIPHRRYIFGNSKSVCSEIKFKFTSIEKIIKEIYYDPKKKFDLKFDRKKFFYPRYNFDIRLLLFLDFGFDFVLLDENTLLITIKKEIPLAFFFKLMTDTQFSHTNYIKLWLDPNEFLAHFIVIVNSCRKTLVQKRITSLNLSINDKVFIFMNTDKLLILNYSTALSELLNSQSSKLQQITEDYFFFVSKKQSLSCVNVLFPLPETKIEDEIQVSSLDCIERKDLFLQRNVSKLTRMVTTTNNNYNGMRDDLIEFVFDIFQTKGREKYHVDIVEKQQLYFHNTRNFLERLMQKLLLRFYFFNNTKEFSFYFNSSCVIRYKAESNAFDLKNNIRNFSTLCLISRREKTFQGLKKKNIQVLLFSFMKPRMYCEFEFHNYFTNTYNLKYTTSKDEKIINVKRAMQSYNKPYSNNQFMRPSKQVHFQEIVSSFLSKLDYNLTQEKTFEGYRQYIDKYLYLK